MFVRLGRWVLRWRVVIVVAWLALAVGTAVLVPSLSSVTSSQEASFLPADSPSRVAAERLAAAFPSDSASSGLTLVFSRPSGLGDTDRATIAAVSAWLRSDDRPEAVRATVVRVEGAAELPGMESMFRSADGTVELLSVRLGADAFGTPARKAVDAIRAMLANLPAYGLDISVTGTAAISRDYLGAIEQGTDRTTLVTVVLVIVILLLIYRAPVAALIPLMTIGAAFAVARATLSLLAQAGWHIPSLLDSFVVVLVFGVGTDYAIFLLSRYREELGRLPHSAAVFTTVGRIGAVIAASAATVIVGLSSMATARFGLVQTIGPALAITIAITLAAGLTLTPSLASLAGAWLYWPRHQAVTDGRVHGPGAWDRLARRITTRPGRVGGIVTVLLVLPLLALPSMRVEFDALAELPRDVEARRGFDVVAAHFDRGQLLPVGVLLEADPGVDLGSPAGLAEVHRLTTLVAGVDGVRAVRGLLSPAGDGTVPEGFRPSVRLAAMATQLDTSGDPATALSALSDPATLTGLEGALAYVDALVAAFPDGGRSVALATARADVAAMRDGIAGYQQAAPGSAERSAALAGIVAVAGRLPGELEQAAAAFAGQPDDLFVPRTLLGAGSAGTARLISTYLSDDGHAAQLSVVTADEPYSAAAFDTVRRLRATLGGEVQDAGSAGGGLVERASVGGPTADSADVQSVIGEDFGRVGLITILGILLVLALLLRSLVAPLYLVATVLLSYGTTLGLSTLLFQGVLGQPGVDYFVPLIVFVLLVALGSDYNIFLMSRVREESATGDLRAGITLASARTGTVITSAGIILAGTFLALTAAPLQILMQTGLSVAMGVLIDTFLVRSLLIPALTVLIGERAWWPSHRTRQLRSGGVPRASR